MIVLGGGDGVVFEASSVRFTSAWSGRLAMTTAVLQSISSLPSLQ